MSTRWRVTPRERRDGSVRWRVHDEEDAGRPVAEFDDEASARVHVDRLLAGPFDWDEQASWQDDDEDDDWGRPPRPPVDER